MDYTVHGVLQARILEWLAIPFSRGFSQPRSPALQAGSLPAEGSCSENMIITQCVGFPHNSVSNESACNAGDLGSISGWEKSPGGGNSNPLQYSCLENPVDREAWRAMELEELNTT